MTPSLKPLTKNRSKLRDGGVAMILLSSRTEVETPEIDGLIARIDEAVGLILQQLNRQIRKHPTPKERE